MAGTAILLYLVFFAIAAYVLYFVVRKAIAHGIRDARRAQERERELQSPDSRP